MASENSFNQSADEHGWNDQPVSEDEGSMQPQRQSTDNDSDVSGWNSENEAYAPPTPTEAQAKLHEMLTRSRKEPSVEQETEDLMDSATDSRKPSVQDSLMDGIEKSLSKAHHRLSSAEQWRRPSSSAPSAGEDPRQPPFSVPSDQEDADINSPPKSTAETELSSAAPPNSETQEDERGEYPPATLRQSVADRAAVFEKPGGGSPVRPSFADSGFTGISAPRDGRRNGVQLSPSGGDPGSRRPYLADGIDKSPGPPQSPRAAVGPRKTPHTNKTPVPEPTKAPANIRGGCIPKPALKKPPYVDVSPEEAKDREDSSETSVKSSGVPPGKAVQTDSSPKDEKPAKIPSARAPPKCQSPLGTGMGFMEHPAVADRRVSFDAPASRGALSAPRSAPSSSPVSGPSMPDYQREVVDEPGAPRSYPRRPPGKEYGGSNRGAQRAESVTAVATGALLGPDEPASPSYKRKLVDKTIIPTWPNTSPDWSATPPSAQHCQCTTWENWCDDCEYMETKVSMAVSQDYLNCHPSTHPIMLECVLKGTTSEAGHIAISLARSLTNWLQIDIRVHAVVRRAASEKHRAGKWYDLTTREAKRKNEEEKGKYGTLKRGPKKDTLLQQVFFWKWTMNSEERKEKERHEAIRRRDFRLMLDIPFLVAEGGPVEQKISSKLSKYEYVKVKKLKIIRAHPCFHRLAWWARTHPESKDRKKSHSEKSGSPPAPETPGTPSSQKTDKKKERSSSSAKPSLKSHFSGTSSIGTRGRKESASPASSRVSPESTSSPRSGRSSSHKDAEIQSFLTSTPYSDPSESGHRRRKSSKWRDTEVESFLTPAPSGEHDGGRRRTKHSRTHRESRHPDELTEMRVPEPVAESNVGPMGERWA
ncbi:uncharacterized protein BDV17DRAFT_289902 [Aspergillus undulatus]|uniref:uncharacterized protein n=1 Tax=Aspergillus undulatus TaxID=1810928 RepID=UPI003CCDB700